MNLLVGCPVFNREWIMPTWFRFVEEAVPEDWGLSYIFAESRRDPTRRLIEIAGKKYDRKIHFVDIVEDVKPRPDHQWAQKGIFDKMVQLRNFLLGGVRELEPELFLSLDSDILCHPDQITNLVETLRTDERKFDAVGGKVFLSSGTDCPSWSYYTKQKGLRRSNIDYVAKVDVIMAVKLMSPAAYAIDYEYEHNGEDIGWSLACARAGLTLGHDGRVTSKHVMQERDGNGNKLIEKIDPRVGF